MRKLLAILIIVSTGFLPLSGQDVCGVQPQPDDAVVREGLHSINSLTLKIQDGTASPEDVDSTITTGKILFAHLEERGDYVAPEVKAEFTRKLGSLRTSLSGPKILANALTNTVPKRPHCKNYSIAAAAYGVCCALGGIPCCILSAVAALFAALCEAGYDV